MCLFVLTWQMCLEYYLSMTNFVFSPHHCRWSVWVLPWQHGSRSDMVTTDFSDSRYKYRNDFFLPQSKCLATGTDEMVHWAKWDKACVSKNITHLQCTCLVASVCGSLVQCCFVSTFVVFLHDVRNALNAVTYGPFTCVYPLLFCLTFWNMHSLWMHLFLLMVNHVMLSEILLCMSLGSGNC